MTDDADEPSGDELDDISARDIAMARYKRNHDYLSEIFTPYNAGMDFGSIHSYHCF